MAATSGIGVLFVLAVIAALAAAKGSADSGSAGTDTSGGSPGTDGTGTGTTGTAASTLIQLLAEAIATAEGFYKAGSVAQRQNNPGNVTQPGTGILTFPSVQDGWNALYNQINLMFSGSGYYNSGMSLSTIGDIYANHDPNWAVNVAAYIGVPVTTTLDQLAAQYG